jgi:hypothetical protein
LGSSIFKNKESYATENLCHAFFPDNLFQDTKDGDKNFFYLTTTNAHNKIQFPFLVFKFSSLKEQKGNSYLPTLNQQRIKSKIGGYVTKAIKNKGILTLPHYLGFF